VDDEAGLIGELAHDIDADRRGHLAPGTVVGAVGIGGASQTDGAHGSA
jgi:hypothetical protein